MGLNRILEEVLKRSNASLGRLFSSSSIETTEKKGYLPVYPFSGENANFDIKIVIRDF